MSAQDYLEELVNDIAKQGVVPSDTSYLQKNNPEDYDLGVILDLERRTGIKYSEEQKKILLHRGSACILACAGSGKTSTSIHLIAKRLITGEIANPDKMLFTTFSKTGVNEMKTRLDKLLASLGIKRSVQVRTLHSFFLQLMRDFGVTASIIKSYDRTKYIKQACKEVGLTVKDEDVLIIDTMLSYQVNNIMSDNSVVSSNLNEVDNLTTEKYKQIRKLYTEKKVSNGVIDYDDMQSYIYLWLVKFAKSDNPSEIATAKSVRDYCKALWDYFFIDEAQDVSKIQYEILREIISDVNDKNKLDKSLVFIGDDDQAIYQWRGSDPSIILSIAPTYDMPTFVLSTNYRCKSEIVDYATVGVKCNSQRYAKSMSAFQTGGKVAIAVNRSESLMEYNKIAIKHIKGLLDDSNTPSEIAVLARNNFHLSILNAMLFKEGIYCHISDEMKLTKSFMYYDIKKILEISVDCWKSDCTTNILWKLCRFMKATTSKLIGDFQSSSGTDLQTTLGYILEKLFRTKLSETYDSVRIPTKALNTLESRMSWLSAETTNDLIAVYEAMKEPAEQCAYKLIEMYMSNTSYMYKTSDKRRSRDGVVQYIRGLLKSDGYDNTMDFLRVLEQFEAGKAGVIGETITLTTIHSAKGREWKNVIMFGCDNITQPNFEQCESLAEQSEEALNEFLAEERRLCYVGNTRAKENLLILTNNTPSVFILEALGIIPSDGNKTIKLMMENMGMVVDNYQDEINKMINEEGAPYKYKG